MPSVLFRNLFWLATSTIGGMAASLVYGLLAARYLGPLGFGRLSLVVGIGGSLISIAQGGGTAALLLITAEDRRHAGQLIWPGVIIQVAVGATAVLVSVPVVWALSRDTSLLWPTVLYGVANIAYLAISVPLSIYRGLDRMEWGVALTATGVGMVILMGIVMRFDLGFTATIAANTLSQVMVLLFVFPVAYAGLRPLAARGWNRPLASRLWSHSLSLWSVTIAQSLHWRTGLVAVHVIAGSYTLGIYSAAAKLVENLRAIPWFVLMAALPTFARASNRSPAELGAVLQRAVRYVLVIAFPLAAVLFILAPWLMGLLYTSAYGPSLQVFQISVFGLVPVFIQWVFVNAMISLKMERQLVITNVIALVGEALLDIWLVPTWGANGAAVGYVVGEGVVAVISGVYVVKAVGGLEWSSPARVVLLGVSMLAIAVALPPTFSPFAAAPGVCLGYLAGLFLMRSISMSELRAVLGTRA
jgi:O-antigen/teichoic acid export membrane protein